MITDSPSHAPKSSSKIGSALAAKISTQDIASSTQEFLRQNYTGRIVFTENYFENRVILFDAFDLARMMKSIIKELTLVHTCAIHFYSENDDFIISFDSHAATPPCESALLHLKAEAEHLGIPLRADRRAVEILIPTRKFEARAIYERACKKFYSILQNVFTH